MLHETALWAERLLRCELRLFGIKLVLGVLQGDPDLKTVDFEWAESLTELIIVSPKMLSFGLLGLISKVVFPKV